MRTFWEGLRYCWPRVQPQNPNTISVCSWPDLPQDDPQRFGLNLGVLNSFCNSEGSSLYYKWERFFKIPDSQYLVSNCGPYWRLSVRIPSQVESEPGQRPRLCVHSPVRYLDPPSVKKQYMWDLPALVDFSCIPRAGEVLDVSPSRTVNLRPVRPAYVQEVWPQPANGILGDIRERLTYGGTEHKSADGLIDTGHITVAEWFWFDAF